MGDIVVAVAPHNLEAEQALLGVLLYDNAAYERLTDSLQGRHFYEPFHAAAVQSIETHIRKGQLAEPILLADEFKHDPAFEELGGLRYLADLVDRAPPAANVGDYARAVFDLALRRDLIRIGGEIASTAHGGVSKDDVKLPARDQIEAAEQQLYTLAESGAASSGFVSFGDALRGAVEMTAEAYSRDGGMSGLATDLIDLDTKIGGLHPSDLIVLAGRPSMGKTALATNIAFNVAKKYAWEPQPDGTKKTVSGGVVAFYSLEMSAEQLALRMLADASGVSGDKLRKGEIDASRVRPGARRGHRAAGSPALYRRHRRHLHRQADRPGPPPEAPGRPGPDRRRLPAAGHRLGPGLQRQPRAGSLADHHGPEGPGQGAGLPGHRPVAAVASGRAARGQASAAVRPSRIGLDRAGRRHGLVRLSRKLLCRPRRAARRHARAPASGRRTWTACRAWPR
jgi:replicative DNA helicase